MNILSAAERLASMDRSSVTYDASRCLYNLDRFATCEACMNLCPTQAIEAGKPPVLRKDDCQSCYACLPACPTSAYAADDAVAALINCALRTEKESLEIVCRANTRANLGVSLTDVAIQVKGCLAGLGAGAYLTLTSLGLKKIVARIDACPGCPWGSLQPRIQQQIEEAKQLLEPYGWSDRLSWASYESLDGLVERLVWNADNPPLSRRDLLRFATRQGQFAVGRAFNLNEPASHKNLPGRDRRRIVAALNHIDSQGTVREASSLEGLGYAILAVSEECTACGVCARACPTGAIIFSQNHEQSTFTMSFEPKACIACHVCQQICAPGAISANSSPNFEEVFGQEEPILLYEGELTRCERCGAQIALHHGSRFCPLCEYRRNNPFGSVLPPGFEGKDRGTSRGERR